MFATAIHAPLPAQAAHYFGATLSEAAVVLRRGAADGGLPNITHLQVSKGLQLCKIALEAAEDFEDTLLDSNKEQMIKHALDLRMFANTGDALKVILEQITIPRSTISARINELYEPLFTQFILVHERITELAEMAEHLAKAPSLDEDSEDFGTFLVNMGSQAIA